MIDTNRRKALKTIGGAGAFLAFGGVSTVAAQGTQRKGASAGETIFELVETNEDFDILEAGLEASGLDAVLNGNDGQYTVFAPTDDDFETLLDTLGISTSELLNNPELTDILLYHVTEGRRYAASVVRTPRIEMLNGAAVTVDGTTLNDDQADIVATDIEASNGVVHVIDGVLLPD
jgi:uncharacterized surface protein with fasciclin (FAS1) repeats